LTLALDRGEWLALGPGHFTPRETAPGTYCIGDWVVRRAGLDAVVKRKIQNPFQDSNSPIIQPVAQRYTTELPRLHTQKLKTPLHKSMQMTDSMIILEKFAIAQLIRKFFVLWKAKDKCRLQKAVHWTIPFPTRIQSTHLEQISVRHLHTETSPYVKFLIPLLLPLSNT
jgi:hypothetical protein